jgi:uncharacterized membrane protein YdjX (TVP38/TMEM64 family)
MMPIDDEPDFTSMREHYHACLVGAAFGTVAALLFGCIWLGSGSRTMATLGMFEIAIAIIFVGWARRLRRRMLLAEPGTTFPP